LPLEERETVDGCLRQIEFLDDEVAELEKQVARDALISPQIKRLMTVPGVNVIVAAIFLAAVGDIGRFRSTRQLVGYLGLDPRVRQSGSTPATPTTRGKRRIRRSGRSVCTSAGTRSRR
jgi:transposase